ncbi:MAG: hypothetical protein CMJ83_21200 [Planctomycetes bacterium]|nr:hypothetical protein [Planctomycetota bacterium]
MPDIVRCPECLSLVYDGADVCHHCATKLDGKRRFLPRRAIAFIIIAVIGWGVVDTVQLLNERNTRTRHDEDAIDKLAQHLFQGQPLKREETFRGRSARDEELSLLVKAAERLRNLNPIRVRIKRLRYLGKSETVVTEPGDWTHDIETRLYRFRISIETSGGSENLEATARVCGYPWHSKVVTFELRPDDSGSSRDG